MTAIPPIHPLSSPSPSITQPYLHQSSIHDSLQPALSTETSYVPLHSKPLLAPPQLGIIQSMEKFDAMSSVYLAQNRERIKGHLEQMRAISDQHHRLVKEAAEKTQTSLFWSTLRNIGAAILVAFSTLFGVTVATSGGSTVVAGSLISSGVLAITNLAFTTTGAWDKMADYLYPDDKKKREKFLIAVPSAVGVLSAGLGLAGGMASWANGSASLFSKEVGRVAQSTINIAEGVTSLGAGVSAAQVNFTAGAVKDLDIKMFLHQADLDRFQSGVSHLMHMLADTHKKSAKIMHLLQESIQTILMG